MKHTAAKRIAGHFTLVAAGTILGLASGAPAQHGIGEPRLPGTDRLDWKGHPEDFSARMVRGIHRFLHRKLDEAAQERERHWDRDLSSAKAYTESIRPNRERFRRIIGLIDARRPVEMERFGTDANPALVAEGGSFRVF